MKTILVDAVHTFVSEQGVVDEVLHALLDTYPNKKIVVTNADNAEMSRFGLDRVPSEVFTLNHKPNKTDPTYFTTMLTHYGFQSDDVVYFEHDAAAVERARSVGIVAYHYVSEEKDYDALQAFFDTHLS